MRRLKPILASVVLAAGLLSAPAARAQIPVTDVAALLRQIMNHAEVLMEWKRQYDYYMEQYQTLTGDWAELFDGGLGQGGEQYRTTFPEELEDFMAEGNALEGALAGDLAWVRQNQRLLPEGFWPGGSELEQRLTAVLNLVGKQQSASDNTYRSAQRNIATAHDLRERARYARTVQSAGQINARISAELLAVASEANRLHSLAMRMEADQQRQADLQMQKYLEAKNRPVVNGF